MSSGWRLFPWIAACACGCGPPALAGGPAAAAPIAVAHSAQLTIEAVEAGDSLAIRIRHAADHTPVNSKDVIVSVDGRSVPVTLADGAYVVSAKELRGRNITVNAIAPGPTATKLFLDGKPQEVIERLSKLAPLERLGQPQDIADAVAFLAGPDGAWINGQTLRANGGII